MTGAQKQISSTPHLPEKEAPPQPSLGVLSSPQSSAKTSGWQSSHPRDFLIINNSASEPLPAQSRGKRPGPSLQWGNCRGEPGSHWESTLPRGSWFLYTWGPVGSWGCSGSICLCTELERVMVILGWVTLTHSMLPCA